MAVVFGVRLDAEVLRVRQLRSGIAAEEVIQVTPRDTRACEWENRRREKMIAEYRTLRRERDDATGGDDDTTPDDDTAPGAEASPDSEAIDPPPSGVAGACGEQRRAE